MAVPLNPALMEPGVEQGDGDGDGDGNGVGDGNGDGDGDGDCAKARGATIALSAVAPRMMFKRSFLMAALPPSEYWLALHLDAGTGTMGWGSMTES